MSRVVLYPYPRLSPSETTWTRWAAQIDGRTVDVDAIADSWDADADLTFRISTTTTTQALESAQADLRRTRLVISVSCGDTAITTSADAPLTAAANVVSATADVTLHGREVSGELELRACLIAPHAEVPWLTRRILIDSPQLRVPLTSSLAGFPTIAYSFNAEAVPDTPWRLIVMAEDIQEPFMNAVRLELNEDYRLVRELMDGNADPHTQAELSAAITRVLIGTCARLRDRAGDSRTLDDLIMEEPDSLVAAAQRAAEQYLKKSLSDALTEYRSRPERFEASLAGGVGMFRVQR